MTTKLIRLDGVIGTAKGEISSNWFQSQLPTDGSAIHVEIHSEGGSVIEGFRIFDLAKAYTGPKTATVHSAFSIASFIPMAFDQVEISPNGYMMLHNPFLKVEGDDEELASKASMLAKMKTNMIEAYVHKTGLPVDQVTSILKTESYLNAREAVAAGFADRVTSKPVIGRVFAKIDSMPHGVVSALFGAGSGGNVEPQEETPMSDSTPVAATISEIEVAFPKAKAEFVLGCVKRQLPMASVAAAAAEEMMKENEELAKANAALSEELEQFKAKAAEGDDDEEKDDEAEAKAEDDDDADAKAKAKTRGVKAVAKGTSSRPTAKAKWTESVQAKVTAGMRRDQAVMAVEQESPGLRDQMLAEVNIA